MKVCSVCFETFLGDVARCPVDGGEVVAREDPFLGRTIASRYRLVRRLGSGGMSLVYLARHELISRLSAIKIMRPQLSRITEHRERFLREARAVNRINHENIVEITDVGEADGVAYLVMEYVEGASLFAHVERGRLEWPRAVRIAMQVAAALARTHQTGIIHRDLKPENILLVPGPTGDVVKLIDFGIAKMSGEPTLTIGDQVFGTPGYIAPEYVGGMAVDGRSDIYALSVVLYEMVTGVLPFDAHGQSELLLKPLTTDPIPARARVPALPQALCDLLSRGLSREPEDRPRDAFVLHDELGALLTRFARSPAHDGATEDAAPVTQRLSAREALATVVDMRAPVPVEEGAGATRALEGRWATSLAALEKRIAAARQRGGEQAAIARRAAELAIVAGEIVPRLERASRRAHELQARVDTLEAEAREARASLGHAIDTLSRDRSRERARLDAVGEDHPEEARRCEAVVDDLGFQIAALQRQLDVRNEELELALLQATGVLEGALTAVRHLTAEIVRAIDDGLAMLPA